jgi:prepilin-type N-terminal cleavage/methylation domain-containing protein
MAEKPAEIKLRVNTYFGKIKKTKMKKKIQNSKFKIQNSQPGFTLTELMVVMAIIGILAGVVLVSMTKYRDRAREAAALQTASSVMPAAMKCVLEGKPFTNFHGGSSSGGGKVCDTTSIEWPTLDTSSTKGWIWGDQVSSAPDNYGYWLCDPKGGGCGDSGTVQILCPITTTSWSAFGLPGACVFRRF